VYTASGDTLRARRVVVTLPLNILHKLDIEPPLSARAGAIESGTRVACEVAAALGVKPRGRTAQACTAQ
jgi:hypothetical protein